ncbi:MAG: DUF2235 domain-containing protein [Kiloniellaceae bacterium]
MATRRFVVCFDGTWNTPDKGDHATNVVKLVRAVRSRDSDGTSQVVFYDKGVGSAGGSDTVIGGGFGRGLTANVIDGYRFLANNYAAGDEIYIFGFSRGAYTARSLAGLIGLVGLLMPVHLGSGLDAVMGLYRLHDVSREEKLARVAKLDLGPRHVARIRCIGVWDTVGALGIPGDLGRTFLGGKYYFHDVELGHCVDIALHAVAVDEKRSAFSPTLWVSDDGRPAGAEQKVEQVWFAGAHSNVGGSYPDCTLSNVTFDWMVKRVTALTGLAIEGLPQDAVRPQSAAGRSIDSRTLLYKDAVAFPYQRVINGCIPAGKGFGEWFRRRFPSYDRRNIPPDGLQTVNEALHVSLLDRWKLPSVLHDCRNAGDCTETLYRPVNLAAVIAAHHAGRTTPVVGWDGEVMAPAAVAAAGVWPVPEAPAGQRGIGKPAFARSFLPGG